jgi:glycosyltransferase involved in cell wall biosynthesis
MFHRVFLMSSGIIDIPGIRPPLVSVIIPAYKAAEHIVRGLESVFAQTFSDYEVIVINDGSPDTSQFLEALHPYRDRIHYLEQENQGPSAARNAGILVAKGEYIAFLDSDDCWFPTYLAEQLRVIEGSPRVSLVYCDALRVGPIAGRWRTCMDASPSSGPVAFESLVREQCVVLTSFTVVRRQAVLDAGLFDAAFRRSEDFDLWVRMARCGVSMAYHRTILGEHTLREDGLSNDRDGLRQAQIAVYRKLLSKGALPTEESALIQTQIARCEAILELDKGKDNLISRRYAAATIAIREANTFYRRPLLRVTLSFLGIAPWAVRWVYLISLKLRIISHRAGRLLRRWRDDSAVAAASAVRDSR